MKILVTGAAGFIGMHLCLRLLERGDVVIGIDNLNEYYDPSLKKARLAQLANNERFKFYKLDISENTSVQKLFEEEQVQEVVHLAAQAGVRYSLTNPQAYLQSNLAGFLNILEGCRAVRAKNLVYASSSSVYGSNTHMPFSESDGVDHPVSLYAATKRANELMAHSYSHLYGLPTTGLRFFTVYGPWGRPDMAYYKFAKAILAGETIPVFNNGELQRDFTFIDDIIDGIVSVVDKPAAYSSDFHSSSPDPSLSNAPFRIFNIGNEQPVRLLDFIEGLEAAFGVKANMQLLPMQPGDVFATHSDTSKLRTWIASPCRSTSLPDGLAKFANWYNSFHVVVPDTI